MTSCGTVGPRVATLKKVIYRRCVLTSASEGFALLLYSLSVSCSQGSVVFLHLYDQYFVFCICMLSQIYFICVWTEYISARAQSWNVNAVLIWCHLIFYGFTCFLYDLIDWQRYDSLDGQRYDHSDKLIPYVLDKQLKFLLNWGSVIIIIFTSSFISFNYFYSFAPYNI